LQLLSESGHAVTYWLRQYATDWKVALSTPDNLNEFILFQFASCFSPHYALVFTQSLTELLPGIKIKVSLRSKALLVREADKFTAVCEPIV
jgi:hypothetical protein